MTLAAVETEPESSMTLRNPLSIRDWHAHVYFDATTRAQAWSLREIIESELTGRVGMGRFHESTVGPHPLWSYQLSIASRDFLEVIGWLTLNRGQLDVFVHPNTGDGLRDHRDSAIWLGRSHILNLTIFQGS